MATVEEVVDKMKGRFNADAAAGLDLIFQFDIEDGGTYHLVVKDGTCELITGANDNPNVTLLMNTDTMKGVLSGELNGMQAFMTGKLRAEGDMMLAAKLGELFSG